MAAPNIAALTTITGKTAVQAVAASATAIVSNSAASGKVLKVNSLYVANIHASTTGAITVDVYRSSTAYRIANAISVPINSVYMVIQKDSPIYLEEGDSLRLTGGAASTLEAVASYEDLS
jgi:uncharacterized protein YyaL (SSP411 family)